jgi:uncharacterized protein YcfJ
MKRALTVFSALVLAATLVGCSSMTRQEQGTLTGAVVGGAAGAAIGGSGAGAVVGGATGALVGGVIGNEITKD